MGPVAILVNLEVVEGEAKGSAAIKVNMLGAISRNILADILLNVEDKELIYLLNTSVDNIDVHP